MGNRLEEGVCLACGGPIIIPSEFYCCSVCTEKLRKQRADILKRKKTSPKAPLHVKFSDTVQATLGPKFKKI